MKQLMCGLVAVFGALAFSACGGDETPRNDGGQDSQQQQPEPPKSEDAGKASVPTTPAEKAKAFYDKICWTCHGKSGHGDGPAGRALKTKPRSFDDKAFHGRIDEKGGLAYLRKVILEGGAAVGLSADMTPHKIYPELSDDKVLAELARYVAKDLGNYEGKLD